MKFVKFRVIFSAGILLAFTASSDATVCKERILEQVRTGAVGTADQNGFQEYESSDASLTLKFPRVLEHLTFVQIKPPAGTKANNKFRAEVTYTKEDGKAQNMRTGMTVSDPEKPLNLPFPSHSMVKEVQINFKVEVGDGELPPPKTLKVAMKGCYVKPKEENSVKSEEENSAAPQEARAAAANPFTWSSGTKMSIKTPIILVATLWALKMFLA